MMTGKKLRVAVVGGGIGQTHLRSFQALPDQFEIVSICDIDEAKALKIAAEFNIPQVHTDLGQLLNLPDVDVIDLCTPPMLHDTQVRQVLTAGKHAICEKPLVGSLQAVDGLAEVEAQSGKRLMPIFQYRFGHGLQKLKFLVERGIAGKAYLTTVETAWLRDADYYAVPWRGKWKTELGGSLISHAIHAHDMLTYIMGPIKSVFARATTRVNPIEVEDTVAASVEMADGSLATLAVTLGSVKQITRHRFCFSNFTAESGTLPYTNSSDPWTFDAISPAIAQEIEQALLDFKAQPEGFTGQFSRFYDALQTGTALPVTLADARAAIELITALYYSSETGTRVDLPIGNTHPRYPSWMPESVSSAL
jgi:predicted dehydrogenase